MEKMLWGRELQGSHYRTAPSAHPSLVRKLTLTCSLGGNGRIGHSGSVNSISWSEDGSRLLSAGEDMKLRIWSLQPGSKPLHSFDSGHSQSIYATAFLPHTGSSQLLSCSGDKQVRVVDLNRMAIKPFYHRMKVRAVAAVDRAVFLSAGEDGTVRLFDVRVKPPARHGVDSAALNDANVIAEQRFDRREGRGNTRVGVNSIAVDPTQPHIFATGGSDPLVRVFDSRMLALTAAASPYDGSGGSSAALRPSWLYCMAPAHLRTPLLASGAHQALGPSRIRHISGIAFSHSGRELVANYNCEHIYSFDTRAHAVSYESLCTQQRAVDRNHQQHQIQQQHVEMQSVPRRAVAAIVTPDVQRGPLPTWAGATGAAADAQYTEAINRMRRIAAADRAPGDDHAPLRLRPPSGRAVTTAGSSRRRAAAGGGGLVGGGSSAMSAAALGGTARSTRAAARARLGTPIVDSAAASVAAQLHGHRRLLRAQRRHSTRQTPVAAAVPAQTIATATEPLPAPAAAPPPTLTTPAATTTTPAAVAALEDLTQSTAGLAAGPAPAAAPQSLVPTLPAVTGGRRAGWPSMVRVTRISEGGSLATGTVLGSPPQTNLANPLLPTAAPAVAGLVAGLPLPAAFHPLQGGAPVDGAPVDGAPFETTISVPRTGAFRLGPALWLPHADPHTLPDRLDLSLASSVPELARPRRAADTASQAANTAAATAAATANFISATPLDAGQVGGSTGQPMVVGPTREAITATNHAILQSAAQSAAALHQLVGRGLLGSPPMSRQLWQALDMDNLLSQSADLLSNEPHTVRMSGHATGLSEGAPSPSPSAALAAQPHMDVDSVGHGIRDVVMVPDAALALTAQEEVAVLSGTSGNATAVHPPAQRAPGVAALPTTHAATSASTSVVSDAVTAGTAVGATVQASGTLRLPMRRHGGIRDTVVVPEDTQAWPSRAEATVGGAAAGTAAVLNVLTCNESVRAVRSGRHEAPVDCGEALHSTVAGVRPGMGPHGIGSSLVTTPPAAGPAPSSGTMHAGPLCAEGPAGGRWLRLGSGPNIAAATCPASPSHVHNEDDQDVRRPAKRRRLQQTVVQEDGGQTSDLDAMPDLVTSTSPSGSPPPHIRIDRPMEALLTNLGDVAFQRGRQRLTGASQEGAVAAEATANLQAASTYLRVTEADGTGRAELNAEGGGGSGAVPGAVGGLAEDLRGRATRRITRRRRRSPSALPSGHIGAAAARSAAADSATGGAGPLVTSTALQPCVPPAATAAGPNALSAQLSLSSLPHLPIDSSERHHSASSREGNNVAHSMQLAGGSEQVTRSDQAQIRSSAHGARHVVGDEVSSRQQPMEVDAVVDERADGEDGVLTTYAQGSLATGFRTALQTAAVPQPAALGARNPTALHTFDTLFDVLLARMNPSAGILAAAAAGAVRAAQPTTAGGGRSGGADGGLGATVGAADRHRVQQSAPFRAQPAAHFQTTTHLSAAVRPLHAPTELPNAHTRAAARGLQRLAQVGGGRSMDDITQRHERYAGGARTAGETSGEDAQIARGRYTGDGTVSGTSGGLGLFRRSGGEVLARSRERYAMVGAVVAGETSGEDVAAMVDEQKDAETYLRCYKGARNVSTGVMKQVGLLGSHSEYVMSGSDDGHIFVWRFDDASLVTVLQGGGHISHAVSCTQGHPYDCMIASCGAESVIKVWSPEAEAEVHVSSAAQQLVQDNVEDVARRHASSSSAVHYHWLNVVQRAHQSLETVAPLRAGTRLPAQRPALSSPAPSAPPQQRSTDVSSRPAQAQ